MTPLCSVLTRSEEGVSFVFKAPFTSDFWSGLDAAVTNLEVVIIPCTAARPIVAQEWHRPGLAAALLTG